MSNDTDGVKARQRMATPPSGVAPVARALLALAAIASSATAQSVADSSRTDNLPAEKGQLSLSTLTVNLSYTNLEIVFVPLDERVLRLLTRDSYLSMERLIQQHRQSIDSAASASGVTSPGLAFVSFHGLAPNTRFDPQLLTLIFHGQQFRPAAWVALSPSFSNQQLDVREQVQAIFIYRRDIPVREAFTLSYLAANNDDWGNRLIRFDAERSRILGSARSRADTSGH
ncbi:MAG: hypothetical protein ACRELE_00725 [Gemmatimonadales bacterium]